MWWLYDKRLIWKTRSISNEPMLMLPKTIFTYESVKLKNRPVSKKHSNENIEINVHLILMMRWEII